MVRAKDILENTKTAILADAISFVSIVDVDAKVNLEGAIMLYIKTSNLQTIEVDSLKRLENRYSTSRIKVEVLIPSTKFIDGKHVENTDSVNIFIKEQ